MTGDKERKFKTYPIGYFHIDIAQVRTAEGKLHLSVAIDRTSKCAFVRLADKANTVTAAAFFDALIEAVPYLIHMVLTDNGIQFADLPKNRDSPTARWRGHPFVAPVGATILSTGSPSPGTHGPTAKSNA